MTIALGILATDGLVIAADTQESFGIGGAKYSGSKILTQIVRGQDRAISATGAGNAGYLDALNQDLATGFVEEIAPLAAEARMRRRLREFYDAHILPLQALPRDERPSADVIVGMSWKSRPSVLLASENSTLRRCKEFVAVGAGREHAAILLSRLLPPHLEVTTQLAAFLAAYTVFLVKEYVEGCGKNTHVTVLQDGNAAHLDADGISLLESRFSDYLKFDALAVNYILARPVNDEAVGRDALLRYLRTVREETQALPHQRATSSGWSLDWSAPSPAQPIRDWLVQIEAFIDPVRPSVSQPRNRKVSRGRARPGQKRP